MAAASRSLDDWRRVFSCANSDIFELIEKALLVAAEDCPKEFMDRRASIAEKLFSSHNSGWNHVGLQVPVIGEHKGEFEEMEGRSVERELGEKYSKVNSSNCDSGHLSRAGLTVVIEEESQLDGEVMKIKEVLCNKQEETEAVLYESLMRLQRMQLSIEILKETQIGRAVNGLRKHNSMQIRTLVRTLIDGWKLVVDKWIDATAAIANVPLEPSHDFVNTCPLMDGGDQLAIQTTTIPFSEDYGEALNMAKLEITKRKLREGYQKVEHAKKLRKIQILKLHELPMEPKVTPKKKSRKRIIIRK